MKVSAVICSPFSHLALGLTLMFQVLPSPLTSTGSPSARTGTRAALPSTGIWAYRVPMMYFCRSPLAAVLLAGAHALAGAAVKASFRILGSAGFAGSAGFSGSAGLLGSGVLGVEAAGVEVLGVLVVALSPPQATSAMVITRARISASALFITKLLYAEYWWAGRHALSRYPFPLLPS